MVVNQMLPLYKSSACIYNHIITNITLHLESKWLCENCNNWHKKKVIFLLQLDVRNNHIKFYWKYFQSWQPSSVILITGFQTQKICIKFYKIIMIIAGLLLHSFVVYIYSLLSIWPRIVVKTENLDLLRIN